MIQNRFLTWIKSNGTNGINWMKIMASTQRTNFEHKNLWPFLCTPINKALSILERSERGTECKQEFYEEPETYLKNQPLRGASLACKASPNVSKTPKSLRISSLHSLRPLTKRNPPKTSYKIPSPRFHRVSLLRKRRSPFKYDFFSSFIVPDLQPSKPLRFSLLQALEKAPVSLGISFPINSPPHSSCKLTILSFQLASPPRIHMDSWWAARNPT